MKIKKDVEAVAPTRVYVVYKYLNIRDTFIVGFDTDIEADVFQQSLLKKKI